MDLRNVINWEIPEGVVVKVMDSNGVVIWNKSNNEPDLPEPLANEIYYTSTDGNIIELSSSYSGVQPISNTYENGIGKMVFRRDLTEIGDYAFVDCYKLTSIKLPSSVKTIGKSAFADCRRLPYINIPDEVTSIGTSAFYYCLSLQNIVIPDSVTNIENSTFGHCESFRNIVLPTTIKTIGDYVFTGCYNLESIIIHESVTSIGEKTFYGCNHLQFITCKAETAPKLGSNVFFDNTGNSVQGEKILYVPENSKGYNTWLSQLIGFELRYITE